MPIDVQYFRNDTFVQITGTGTVTEEEYLCAHKQIYSCEERAGRYRAALADFSGVGTTDVSTSTIRAIADMVIQAAKLAPSSAAIAVVGSRAFVYGIGRQWEAYVAESGLRTRVFEDRDEAEQWLQEQLDDSEIG